MHAPDMVFANHTAGESAQGAEVRDHIARIFAAWPDMRFETRRLYVRDVYSDSVSILRQVGLLD